MITRDVASSDGFLRTGSPGDPTSGARVTSGVLVGWRRVPDARDPNRGD
jgi:hypothetical protein